MGSVLIRGIRPFSPLFSLQVVDPICFFQLIRRAQSTKQPVPLTTVFFPPATNRTLLFVSDGEFPLRTVTTTSIRRGIRRNQKKLMPS